VQILGFTLKFGDIGSVYCCLAQVSGCLFALFPLFTFLVNANGIAVVLICPVISKEIVSIYSIFLNGLSPTMDYAAIANAFSQLSGAASGAYILFRLRFKDGVLSWNLTYYWNAFLDPSLSAQLAGLLPSVSQQQMSGSTPGMNLPSPTSATSNPGPGQANQSPGDTGNSGMLSFYLWIALNTLLSQLSRII
jgi:hypothetical protein